MFGEKGIGSKEGIWLGECFGRLDAGRKFGLEKGCFGEMGQSAGREPELGWIYLREGEPRASCTEMGCRFRTTTGRH